MYLLLEVNERMPAQARVTTGRLENKDGWAPMTRSRRWVRMTQPSLLRLAHLVITRRVMCETLLKPRKQEVCQLRFVSPGDPPELQRPALRPQSHGDT
jgi:hypothetical protein